MPDLNCVDMSNWGGELTDAEAQEMRELGVHTVIVGCGPGAYGQWSQQQAAAAVRNGLRLEAYAFVEWGSNPEWWMERARASLGASAGEVLRFWPDFEDVSNPRPEPLAAAYEYMDRAFAAADRLFPGIEVGYYGAHWYHVGHLGNPDRWRERQLWNAYYDGQIDVDALPYGGWTRESVAIEQYQGTTVIAGQSVDLNHMYIDPRRVRREEMTDDERRLMLYVASVIAGEESGQEFRTVGEALAVFAALENPGDKRVLAGLRATQERVGALEAGIEELLEDDGSAAREALAEALVLAAEKLQEGR